MSQSIGTLFLELELNTEKYTAGMQAAKAQAEKLERDLKRTLNIGGRNSFDIAPKVDLSGLHELNRVYDSKIKHRKQVQADLDKNPITPRVDSSALDALEKQLDRLSGKQIHIAAEVRAQVSAMGGAAGGGDHSKEIASTLKDISGAVKDIRQAVKGVSSLPQAIASQLQPSAVSQVGSAIGGVLSVPGQALSGAVGTIATGALENVGREATADFSKGLSLGINRELSFLIGSFDKVGNQLGQGLIKGVLDSFGRDADMITKVLEAAIGKQTILVEGAAVRGKQSAEARSNRGFASAQSAKEFEFVKSNRGEISKLAKQLDTESKELARKESVIRDRVAEAENSLGMEAVSQTLESSRRDYQTIQTELLNQLKRQEQAREDIDTFQKKLDTASNPATRKDAQVRLALAEETFADSSDIINVLQAQATTVKADIDTLSNRVEMIAEIAANRFQGLMDELTKADDLLANKQRQFERYVNAVETFDLLDVPSDMATSSPVVNRARKKDSPEAQQVSRNYQILVGEVAKRSGVSLANQDIPRLVANENLQGANAMFVQDTNSIQISSSVIEALNQGTLTSKQLETLVHELRHAAQSDFGRAGENIAIPTLDLTPEEQQRYGPGIERSVLGGRGGSESYRRTIESDAYAFAGRESADIGEALSRQRAIDSLQLETGIGGGKIKDAYAQIEKQYVAELLSIQSKFDIDSSPEAAKAVQAFALVEQRVNDLANSAANLDDLSIEEISKLQFRLRSALEKAEAALKKQVEKFESTVQGKAVLGEPLQMPVNPLREPELVEVAQGQPQKQRQARQATAQAGVSQSSSPIENVSQQIEGVADDVKERLTFQDIEEILSELNQVAAGFKTKYTELKKQIKENVKAGQENIARAQIEAYLKTSEESRTEIEQVIEMLRSEGVDVGVESALGSRFQGIKGQLAQKETFAKRQLNKLPEATSVGGNISEGMAQGVEPQAVVDAIENMAEAGIKAAEDTLEIQSPSKRFFRMGLFSKLGFNLGFSKGPSTVSADLEEELKAAQKAVEEFARTKKINKNDTQFTNRQSAAEQSLNEAEQASAKFDRAEMEIERRFAKSQSGLDNTLIQAEAGTESLVGRINRVLKSEGIINGGGWLAELKDQALGVVQGFLGFGALSFVGPMLGELANQSVNVATQLEGLRNTLKLLEGDSVSAAQSLDDVFSRANELGVDARASVSGFVQTQAAARGTSLEGQGAEDVFDAVQQASAVFQLSGEQTERTLLALQQMLSKGSVQAEELRGQLGEALPGAFQIAARSMGVTTQELSKMLEQGQVVSDEFLPAFAQQLEAETFSGLAASADSAQASMNRFNNTVFELQASVGENLLPARQVGVEALTAGLKLAQENAQLLITTFTVLSASMAMKLGGAAIAAAKSLGIIPPAMMGIRTATTATIKTLAVFAVKIGLINAALKLGQIVFSAFGENAGELGDIVESNTDRLERFADSLDRIAGSGEKAADSLGGVKLTGPISVLTEGIGGFLTNEASRSGARGLADRTDIVGQASNFIKNRFAQKQQNDALEAADALQSNTANVIAQAAEFTSGPRNDELQRFGELDKELQVLRQRLRVTEALDTDNLAKQNALEGQINRKLEERERLVGDVGTTRQVVDEQLKTQEDGLAALKVLYEQGSITAETYNTAVADLTPQIALLKAQQELFNQALDQSVVDIERIADAISDAAAALDAAAINSARAGSIGRSNLARAQIAGASEGQIASLSRGLEQQALASELSATAQAIAKLNAELSSVDLADSLNALGGREALSGLRAPELARMQDRIGDTDPASTKTLGLLINLDEYETQALDIQARIDESAATAAMDLRALGESITDYYQGISESFESTMLEVEQTLAQAEFNQLQADLTRSVNNITDEFLGTYTDTITDTIQSIFDGVMEGLQLEATEAGIRQQLAGTIQQGVGLMGQVPGQMPVITSGVATDVVNLAEQWDGKHFNEGVFAQCAYFVREVFKSAGIELGVSADKLSSGDPRAGELGAGFASSLIGSDIGQVGRTSDPTAIPAGAIVGFTNTYGNFEQGAITHVGVSTGDGQMVDRSTQSRPVQERAISTFKPDAQGQYVYVIPSQLAAPAMANLPQAQARPQTDFSNLTVKGQAASQEQINNARIIAEVGRSLGANNEEIAGAIATAIQESNLINLTGGDRDSLGLFQQRPSMEWGSRNQISDPVFSAESFYTGRGSNIGLLETQRGQDIFARSHQVQRSAHPDAPRQWDQEGQALATALTGGGVFTTPAVNTSGITQGQDLAALGANQQIDAAQRQFDAQRDLRRAEAEANTRKLQQQLLDDRRREDDSQLQRDREIEDANLDLAPDNATTRRTRDFIQLDREQADSTRDLQRQIEDMELSYDSAQQSIDEFNRTIEAAEATGGDPFLIAQSREQVESLREAQSDLLPAIENRRKHLADMEALHLEERKQLEVEHELAVEAERIAKARAEADITGDLSRSQIELARQNGAQSVAIGLNADIQVTELDLERAEALLKLREQLANEQITDEEYELRLKLVTETFDNRQELLGRENDRENRAQELRDGRAVLDSNMGVANAALSLADQRGFGNSRQMNELRENMAIAEENMRFAEQLESIHNNADLSADAIERMTANAEAMHELNLEGINAQFSEMTEILQMAQGHATDAFASFLDGSKTAGEAFSGFIDSMISGLAQMASQLLMQEIFGGLFGGLGGAAGGGSGIFGIVKGLFGAADGGYVPNFMSGGSIADAYRRESMAPGQPRLAMLNTTEAVLTQRHQAQINAMLAPMGSSLDQVFAGNYAGGGYMGQKAAAGVAPSGTRVAPAISISNQFASTGDSQRDGEFAKKLERRQAALVRQIIQEEQRPRGLLSR
ncbi:tape measure protein [Leptothoe sp. ISB3NOV94-8A]